MIDKLSHLDDQGKARMVDVTSKETTVREASATGKVLMKPETVRLIESGGASKGDVLGAARIAGIMGAKKTADMIPLCHPLELTGIDVQFTMDAEGGEVHISSQVKNVGRTGVEMEALTAVTIAALTIYDMCKSVDREMVLSDIKLMTKRGGKSGPFVRKSVRPSPA
jgi:cyclic pyranopterin monophosphate synthase